jgi:hypothetical protein
MWFVVGLKESLPIQQLAEYILLLAEKIPCEFGDDEDLLKDEDGTIKLACG